MTDRTFKVCVGNTGLHWLLAFAVLLTLYAGAQAKFTQARSKGNQFLIKKWTTEEGLPQNTVTSIVQTSDGYIWLGTFGGLARFDGISFTIFDSTNTPGLRTNRILSLYENPHGGLWIGTDSGEVYFIKNGVLEEFHADLDFVRKEVWSIVQDGFGHLFISSTLGIEAFDVDSDGWPVSGSGRILARGDSIGLFRDRNGRVWTKLDWEIVLIDEPGYSTTTLLGTDLANKVDVPVSIFDMAFDETGRAIIGAYGSLGILDGSKYEEITPLDYKVHRGGFSVDFFDGRFWFQQANELYEIDGSNVVVHDLSAYLKNGTRSILNDREGNIWLATQADGLIKLTKNRTGSASELIGKDLTGTYAVTEDRNGTIWITGRPLYGIRGDNVITVSKVKRRSLFPVLQSMAVDAANRLWVGGENGLFYLENEQLVEIQELKDDHVQALFSDRDGVLWIGTEKGLVKLSKDRGLQRYSTLDGLPSNEVHFVTQADDGTIWIGTLRGVSRFAQNEFKNITLEDGLSGDFVRDIEEDQDGDIWIGTYGGGINRIRDGKLAAITKRHGLLNNFISRIIIDDDGKFWILTNQGIFVVTRDELNRVADGTSNILNGAIFGVADGMRSSEANGGHQPAGLMASDGKLWFPVLDDFVILDSDSLSRVPPEIMIENASSTGPNSQLEDRRLRFDTETPINVEGVFRNLEIIYTGLSFTKPEGLRFRYKLEGLDQDWIDAGNRRRAFFPYLPPGDYKFLVKAVSASGVWSRDSASVSIHVSERFWETRWFVLLAFLAAFALILLFIMNRVRLLKERQVRQVQFARQLINASEVERKRIATDLHDSLSQNLLLIKNWSILGRDPDVKDRNSKDDYLEKITSVAAASLDETRSIIRNLGPQNLKRTGLTEAIINILENIEDAFGVVFEKEIENIDDLFSEEAELNIYRIVQESLNNVLKHSESPRALVKIKKMRAKIEIQITDFGVGFQVADFETTDPGGNAGIGLRSLYERSELLGGTVLIDSTINEGTTVSIRIPVENEPRN